MICSQSGNVLKRSEFFPFRVDPSSEGRQIYSNRIASPKSVSIHLEGMWHRNSHICIELLQDCSCEVKHRRIDPDQSVHLI